MSEWTDDRIIDALQTQSTWFGNDAIIKCADAYDVVTQVRDDLQARVAELEAQLSSVSRALIIAVDAEDAQWVNEQVEALDLAWKISYHGKDGNHE